MIMNDEFDGLTQPWLVDRNSQNFSLGIVDYHEPVSGISRTRSRNGIHYTVAFCSVLRY
jgi:hypothetical protein